MATELTWLGHSSFRVDTPGGTRIYVDPFLNGNPKCPESELEPERCDLIVLTHGHGDHIGDTVAIHQRFGCPVVAQVELRAWLTRQDVADDNSASSPNKGGTVAVGDMSLIGRIYSPDLAVLPIGDHFTMGPREAAVALELLGVARCVPCHYGTFGLLTGTPDQLRELAPAGVEILSPEPGEPLAL